MKNQMIYDPKNLKQYDKSNHFIIRSLMNGDYKDHFSSYENYTKLSNFELVKHLYDLIYGMMDLEQTPSFKNKDFFITSGQMLEIAKLSNLSFFISNADDEKMFFELVELVTYDYIAPSELEDGF